MVQMRRLLHQTMPGFADLFEDDKLFHKSIALPIALKFSSADAVRRAGIEGITSYLNQTKVRFQAAARSNASWPGQRSPPSRRNSR